MMVDYATVQLHRETKERLAALRRPGESFDAAVQRLLDAAVAAEEAAFFDELDAAYLDKAHHVALDDAWPTS